MRNNEEPDCKDEELEEARTEEALLISSPGEVAENADNCLFSVGGQAISEYRQIVGEDHDTSS